MRSPLEGIEVPLYLLYRIPVHKIGRDMYCFIAMHHRYIHPGGDIITHVKHAYYAIGGREIFVAFKIPFIVHGFVETVSCQRDALAYCAFGVEDLLCKSLAYDSLVPAYGIASFTYPVGAVLHYTIAVPEEDV